MGKQDNIYEKGNLSGLSFTFNEEVAEVFEDMIQRSVPGYKTSLNIITHYAKNFYKDDPFPNYEFNDDRTTIQFGSGTATSADEEVIPNPSTVGNSFTNTNYLNNTVH